MKKPVSYIRGVKIYDNWNHTIVAIGDEPLSLGESLKHYNRSPSGFTWGYGGAGPHQLAFAILSRYLKPDIAEAYTNQFTDVVISKLPQTNFEMPVDTVKRWLRNRTPEERRNARQYVKQKQSDRRAMTLYYRLEELEE